MKRFKLHMYVSKFYGSINLKMELIKTLIYLRPKF
jgi:hypothetical protein